MSDLKTKIGLQGSDYYKPVEYKSTKTNKHEINKRNSKENP